MLSHLQPSELIECMKHWSKFRTSKHTGNEPTIAELNDLAVFVAPLADQGRPTWEQMQDLHTAVNHLAYIERTKTDEEDYGRLFTAQINAHNAARVVLGRPTTKQ